LDVLILKTISLEAKNGWAIAKRIQQISKEVLQVQQGSLYPGAATGGCGSTSGAETVCRNVMPGTVC
jgi:hypothetical protein